MCSKNEKDNYDFFFCQFRIVHNICGGKKKKEKKKGKKT